MSDEKLRDLEDRWRQSGALADEIRYLAERVRLGVLPYADLIAAALLGYPAAVEVAREFTAMRGARMTEAVTLGPPADEIRAQWPTSFDVEPGQPFREADADVRAVLTVQRSPTTRHPHTRVRVSRAYVQGPLGCARRFVLCIEISPDDPALLPGEPFLTPGVCDKIGFPHVWRFEEREERWRICTLCDHTEPVPGYVPPTPAAPDDLPIESGAINYNTGRFSVPLFLDERRVAGPEATGRFNYTYVAPGTDGVEDVVRGEVLGTEGRVGYAPIKPGSLSAVFEGLGVVIDDGRGRLNWRVVHAPGTQS